MGRPVSRDRQVVAQQLGRVRPVPGIPTRSSACRLHDEHDRVDQLSATESDQEPGAFPHRESGTETAVSRNT